MKGLALEYVVKLVILLVVALVVINLILYFSNEIKPIIHPMDKGEVKTEIIEAKSFSTSQVATYVRACWEKTGPTYDKDEVCYILKGDTTSVDKELLKNLVKDIAIVKDDLNLSKNIIVIKYVFFGHKVVVEN